jgi:hypothetical protein
MTKTENINNPHSCWNRAEDDEPVFVLRAHDPLATELVRDWCKQYMLSKGGFGGMTRAQLHRYHDAQNVADAMYDWLNRKAGIRW